MLLVALIAVVAATVQEIPVDPIPPPPTESAGSKASSDAAANSQSSNGHSSASSSSHSKSSSEIADSCGCKGDPNAILKKCPTPCPATCENPDRSGQVCPAYCILEGCECKPGYLLHNKKCILPEQCPGYKACPKRCRPTCAVPNPENCEPNPFCHCPSGYVLSKKGGKCIHINQCPTDLGCNGDLNAIIRERPPPCPSTCEAPNEIPCKKKGLDVGCVCKAGYILEDNYGQCIDPNTCPGGNPCGVNGTFLSCKVDCPTKYCPENDSRIGYICDPLWPCPSGCGCKYKYRYKSREDKTCILAEECPPVECTRQYEVWNSCPPPCVGDSCSEVKDPPPPCQTFVEPACYPQCFCKPDYGRNSSDVCIPVEDCP